MVFCDAPFVNSSWEAGRKTFGQCREAKTVRYKVKPPMLKETCVSRVKRKHTINSGVVMLCPSFCSKNHMKLL